MKTLRNIVLGILNILIRLSIACLVVIYVYRFAMASYHFGYMIFTDGAKEVAPGRDITVAVELDDSAYDIGKVLQNRGVIDDAKLFFVQEYLSEYHKKLLPGTYTLNTSMKPSEILKVLAADQEQEEEEEDSQESQDGFSSMDQPEEDTFGGEEQTGEEEQTEEAEQTDSEENE